jgi:molybdopterin synthase sulfur carrier subunit
MAQGTAATAAIRIRLFAGLRERAGWAEQSWPWPAAGSGAALTPHALWEALALPGALSEVRVAINQQFAAADTPLQPGDELAFLPPISGG